MSEISKLISAKKARIKLIQDTLDNKITSDVAEIEIDGKRIKKISIAELNSILKATQRQLNILIRKQRKENPYIRAIKINVF